MVDLNRKLMEEQFIWDYKSKLIKHHLLNEELRKTVFPHIVHHGTRASEEIKKFGWDLRKVRNSSFGTGMYFEIPALDTRNKIEKVFSDHHWSSDDCSTLECILCVSSKEIWDSLSNSTSVPFSGQTHNDYIMYMRDQGINISVGGDSGNSQAMLKAAIHCLSQGIKAVTFSENNLPVLVVYDLSCIRIISD